MSSFRNKSWIFAAIAALLTVASCSTGESADLYAPVPTATATAVQGLTTTTTSGVKAATEAGAPVQSALDADIAGLLVSHPVGGELFDEVELFYDNYLTSRASVIDRLLELDDIADLVTGSGRSNVAEARDYNDSLHAEGRLSAINDLWLFSNVESISQLDEQTILVRDCTEQHEVNSLDQFWIYWVTNEVLIDVSSGQMKVASFKTIHNGFFETDDPIGCAPLSFRERGEAVAAQVWTELAEWSRRSDSRIDANLSLAIGDPLRQRILDAVDDTGSVEVGETVEDASFEAVGLDVAASLGVQGGKAIVVVVNSCHRFPEGRSGTNRVSGAALEDIGAGAEQALQFRVLLDPNSDDRVDQVIAIDFLDHVCS